MLGQAKQDLEAILIENRFEKDMARVMLDVEKLTNRYLFETPMTPENALLFGVEFDKMLIQSGYYEAVNNLIGDDFNKLLPLINDGLNMGGLISEYSQSDLSRVMDIKNIQSNKFSIVSNTAGTTLRDNLYKYVLGNFTAEDMATQIAEDFKGTNLVRHSSTLANSTIREFQESVIDLEAKELKGVWVYVGVRDKLTRDYCRCILEKGYYYDDKDKNKLQSDSKRKYNCRHRFRIVSVDFAKDNGYKKARSLCQ